MTSLLRRVSAGSRTSVKLRAGNKRQWSSDGSHTVGLLMKIRNEANQVFLRKTYTLVQRKCYQWREMAWNCLNVMTQCFIGHLIIVRLHWKVSVWSGVPAFSTWWLVVPEEARNVVSTLKLQVLSTESRGGATVESNAIMKPSSDILFYKKKTRLCLIN